MSTPAPALPRRGGALPVADGGGGGAALALPVPETQVAAGDGAAGGGGALSSEDACICCFARATDCVLVPCGHACCCGNCARGLQPAECPACSERIEQVVMVRRLSQPAASMEAQ